MARVIGWGRYATETYPDPPRVAGGAGTLLQVAEDDATVGITVPDSPEFVLRDGVVPLEVSFADWTPGDVLVVEHDSVGSVNPDIGPLNYSMTPKINVGAGWQTATPTSGVALVNFPNFGGSGMGTTAVRLQTAPTVRLEIANDGSGDEPNGVFPILLRAYRYSGASWVQGPINALV